MTAVRLHGADYSVYVRIARMTLLEKQVEHETVPVDVFATTGLPDGYLDLHPFGRIPALEHGDFSLHETTAITRYVDEAFPGPALQPQTVRERAVMNQIIAILDSYAYRAMVWDIYVGTVSKPKKGEPIDFAKVGAATKIAETVLSSLAKLKRSGPFLLGKHLTLGDLHAAPIFGHFMQADMAAAMLEKHPNLDDWWQTIQNRPNFRASVPTS